MTDTCIRCGGFLFEQCPNCRPPSMDALQEKVGTWATTTFPQSTDESKLKHLQREVKELLESGKPEEAADCALILMHYAHAHGFSLFDECRKKFEIAKKRKWGAPDGEGVQEHIRE